MVNSLLIGVGGIVLLMIVWAVVQFFWGKTFPDEMTDEDVLAGRTSCGNCGCVSICKNYQRSSDILA
jgi:hypothetical protein